MAAIRGRTINTFGGLFTPIAISGGSKVRVSAHLAAHYGKRVDRAARYRKLVELTARKR